MKKLTLICVLVMACLLVTPFAYAGELEKMKKYCSSEWPGDWQMIEFCYNNQVESFLGVMEDYKKYQNGAKTVEESSDEFMIILRCLSEWDLPQFDTHDWQMVEFCVDNQFKSYSKMK